MLKWLALLPANILFVALSFALSPILAAISVVAGVTTLPGFLQWFSTMDDTLDGGQHQHPEIYPAGVKGFALWKQRTRWIARNPAHGWQTRALGFPTLGMTVVFQGAHYTRMRAADGKTYFSFRFDKPFKFWIGWSPKAYDGKFHQYEFQPLGIKLH